MILVLTHELLDFGPKSFFHSANITGLHADLRGSSPPCSVLSAVEPEGLV